MFKINYYFILASTFCLVEQVYAMDQSEPRFEIIPSVLKRPLENEGPLPVAKRQKTEQYQRFKESPMWNLVFNDSEYTEEKAQILAALICLECDWIKNALQKMASVETDSMEGLLAKHVLSLATVYDAEKGKKLILDMATTAPLSLKKVVLSFMCLAVVRNNALWAQELILQMADSEVSELRIAASGVFLALMRNNSKWALCSILDIIESDSLNAQKTVALTLQRALALNALWAQELILAMFKHESINRNEAAAFALLSALLENSAWAQQLAKTMILGQDVKLRNSAAFCYYEAIKKGVAWAKNTIIAWAVTKKLPERVAVLSVLNWGKDQIMPSVLDAIKRLIENEKRTPVEAPAPTTIKKMNKKAPMHAFVPTITPPVKAIVKPCTAPPMQGQQQGARGQLPNLQAHSANNIFFPRDNSSSSYVSPQTMFLQPYFGQFTPQLMQQNLSGQQFFPGFLNAGNQQNHGKKVTVHPTTPLRAQHP